MGPGGRDRERLDRGCVAAYVAEIGQRRDRGAGLREPGPPRAVAAQRRGHTRQVGDTEHLQPFDQRRLMRAVQRDEQPSQPAAPRALRGRERAGAGAHVAAQGQLAEHRERRQLSGGQHSFRGEDRAGDREVESRSRLAQVSRGKIDRDAPLREDEAGVEDRRLDALASLRDGAVGETDDREGREPRAQIGLDGHRLRVEAIDRERRDASEHAAAS